MVAWMGRDIPCGLVIPDAAIAAGVRDSILISGAAGIVLEPRVLPEERELDRPDGAVPLLADDDLRDPLVGRLLVVHLVAVDEEDHVGVLLQRPTLAKIRH